MEELAFTVAFLGGLSLGTIITMLVAYQVWKEDHNTEVEEETTYFIRFKHREGKEGEYFDERTFVIPLESLDYGYIVSKLAEIDRAGKDWEYLITEIHEV